MSEIKLKRCPFCNEELEVVGKGHYFAHKTNGCILQHLCFETDDEEVVNRWNTRKSMQEIVEILEEELDYSTHNYKEDEVMYRMGIRFVRRVIKKVGGMRATGFYLLYLSPVAFGV